MKILILGGTLFLGKHLVDAAHARGHEVTLFNRGQTNPTLFPDVETLRGDRNGDMAALKGRTWDAVIDTSGYLPRVVRASATLLADAVDRYVFISSGSVYADLSASNIDETAALSTLPDEATEDIPSNYGALKVLCERAVKEIMPDRGLVVRSGLLVGPHDPTGRFTYWVRRVAQGGTVLAPGHPQRQVQLIHARDMADWMVCMTEAKHTGTYNVTGPASTLTMEECLAACRMATNNDAQFAWIDDAFLLAHNVAPFGDMPLWLPDEMNGLLRMNIDQAFGAGLTFRPLVDTIRETLAWDAARSPADIANKPRRLQSGGPTQAGITREREEALFQAWRAVQQA